MNGTARPATLVRTTLLCLAWSLPAHAATPRVTADMPIAEFAQVAVGKEFYGAYLFGSKVGWMGNDAHLAEYQGEPVVENTVEIRFQVRASDDQKQMRMLGNIRYSLQGKGEIISIEENELEDGKETRRTAVREGGNLRISTRESSGKTSERLVPLPRCSLSRERDLHVWMAAPRRKGDKFRTCEVDLAAEKIETESVMEYLAVEPLVWGGVSIRASRVRMHVDGIDFTALVAPDGTLLRGKVAGLVEIRAETEQVAKTFGDQSIDLLAASSVKVEKPLGDRASIAGLTLELSGLGDFQLPSNARQRVQRTGKGRATVELSREAAQPEAVSLTADERARFLRATPGVQNDDAGIRDLAARIVGDERDPVKAAARIVDWLAANMRQSYGAEASTATAVLAQLAGDCTEHTLLFTALARAAGIPARQLGGIIYVENPEPLFGWHAWAQIHDGTGWIGVDPTWRQVRVDPTHVQFSFSGDDLARDDLGWVKVIAGLKVKVKKVSRTG